MARFALLFLALTTLVAAALAAKSLPIDQAANAWDGGSCRAELVPEDGGCTLQGEILQDQVIDAARGQFHGEARQVGRMEAHPACGHAVKACGKILACRCPGAPR